MCQSDQTSSDSIESKKKKVPQQQQQQQQEEQKAQEEKGPNGNNNNDISNKKRANGRRGKRIKQSQLTAKPIRKLSSTIKNDTETTKTTKTKRVKSSLISRHEGEGKSGGIDALLPSLIAVVVIGCGIVAKMGWRGRATVAGIDLGTTNSVICVQQQSQGGEVGKIECIPDPFNNSPIVPSVISFLEPKHYSKTKPYKKKEELGYNLDPSPSYVIVGSAAKDRINTHPHHTLYHAKRVLGRNFDDDAVQELSNEVEFDIIKGQSVDEVEINDTSNEHEHDNNILFHVPYHGKSLKSKTNEYLTNISLKPHQVGSYVINHLMEITTTYLGHDNVKSAVIAVPAKFNSRQRRETVQAFKDVGVNVARILEEPVAAALAYGLQKKENVDYIIVYDFGGGTLDVSVLQVFDGGYVEVIGNDGDNRLGGADFDAAVAHYLLESHENFGSNVVNKVMDALHTIEQSMNNSDEKKKSNDTNDNGLEERLVAECSKLEVIPLCSLSSLHTLGEQMKIELSSYPNGDGVVSRQCLGMKQEINNSPSTTTTTPKQISDLCDVLEPIDFQITSKDYDIACTKLYERSLSPVSRILKELDLTVDEIDEVVMVGGTTRMPQIREMVKKELQIESLNTSIDPDLTVAYGAASVID